MHESRWRWILAIGAGIAIGSLRAEPIGAGENISATQPAAPGQVTTQNQPSKTAPNQAGSDVNPATSAQSSGAAPLQQSAADNANAAPETRWDLQLLHGYGVREQLAARGISEQGALTGDYSKDFAGGLSTASHVFRHLLDVRINIDTKAFAGVEGGLFSVDFQNQNGQNGSDRIVGDLQRFDNIDADGRTEISELWYQQYLLGQGLRLKVGKVDANTEFAQSVFAPGFLHSAFGYSPTIFLLPTYPDGAMSVNAFVYPTPSLYAGVGIYDGSGAIGVETGAYGPRHFFTRPGYYFTIAEAGVRWTLGDAALKGRAAMGGFYDNARLHRFDGSSESGTAGAYALAEQTLWHAKNDKPDDPVGIGAFLQLGYADPHVSNFAQHVGGGLLWTGPIPTDARANDSLGVGFSDAGLTRAPGAHFVKDHELAIEGFYGLQLTDYLTIKPDLQYISNTDGRARDAFVGTLRVTLAF